MTYQEIKNRLSKCELTLEKVKNGNYTQKEVDEKTKKLKLLRESYVKLLQEAEKGVVFTDDEKKAKELADDGTNVKLTVKERLREQEGTKFSVDETKSIARKVGAAVAKSLKGLGDEVAHMKAKNIEENSFEIYVQYKNDRDDEFSFYIVDDTLHLTDFSFDKEIADVGVKPSGEALVNVDVVANELTKHFKSLNEDEEEDARNDADYERGWHDDPRADEALKEAPEGMSYFKVSIRDARKAEQFMGSEYRGQFEMNGSNVYYFDDESIAYDAMMDLGAQGIEIEDTNIEESVKEGEVDKEADRGDLDIGHQDDEPSMLKASAFETAEYAAKLVKKLAQYDKHDGEVDFPNWWQKKLILARDYMSAAFHYLDSEEKQPAIDQLALEGKEELKEWGSSDQNIFNQSIHKALGEPKSMPSPFSQELESAAEDAVDHYWDDWEEYETDREGLIEHAKKAYLRSYFKETFNKMVQMFSESVNEEMDENRFLAASMEDLEQVIRNLAHTGEMSEDEAIELAIRKLEAMLDGRDDMDEGRKDNDALFPDNPRLPEIKKLADKIVSMVKAEAAQGDLGYIKTMEEIRYQQEDDFERTPEWNKAKGIRADFNEGIAKTQKAHGLVVAKMKELAKQYKAGDTSVVAQLKDLTAKKKQLEKQLEKDVTGKNRNQQLDTNIDEGEGKSLQDLEMGEKFTFNGKEYTFIELYPELEDAAKVIRPNGEKSVISFGGGKVNTGKKAGMGPHSFGQGKGHHIDEDHSKDPNDKYVVRPCKNKKEPWAVWEGEKRVKGFAEKKDAQAYADKQNKEQGLNEKQDKVKHQGSNYKWPMSQATKDRKEADKAAQAAKRKSLKEEKSTCCGKCGRKHVKGTKCKTPYLKGKDHCRTK